MVIPRLLSHHHQLTNVDYQRWMRGGHNPSEVEIMIDWQWNEREQICFACVAMYSGISVIKPPLANGLGAALEWRTKVSIRKYNGDWRQRKLRSLVSALLIHMPLLANLYWHQHQ